MSEKWHKCEMCIVINDKSQGSIAKHLRIDELLNYAFIIQSAGDRIFKTGEVTGKMVTVSCATFALHFFLKDAGLGR